MRSQCQKWYADCHASRLYFHIPTYGVSVSRSLHIAGSVSRYVSVNSPFISVLYGSSWTSDISMNGCPVVPKDVPYTYCQIVSFSLSLLQDNIRVFPPAASLQNITSSTVSSIRANSSLYKDALRHPLMASTGLFLDIIATACRMYSAIRLHPKNVNHRYKVSDQCLTSGAYPSCSMIVMIVSIGFP